MKSYYQSLMEKAVFSPRFPCVGAQKVIREQKVGWLEASAPFGSAGAAKETWQALAEWAAATYPGSKASRTFNFASFVALYPEAGPAFQDAGADQALWQFLVAMHELDRERYPWDPAYSNFVYDPRFEMSFAGQGHFTVLMGPQATTASRWFPVPALVFNPAFVFEKLRAAGMYGRWREVIRSREKDLQKGWINPKLGDFGELLAAPQYALSLAPEFDIGDCPFTGAPRPQALQAYGMGSYPFAPGEPERLFWESINRADP